MGPLRIPVIVLAISGLHLVTAERKLRGSTTQLLDTQVGLGNALGNYAGVGVKATQTNDGSKSSVTSVSVGNTLTAAGTTQLGTFQTASFGNGTAPAVAGQAGVIVGGYPVGVGASSDKPLPTLVTQVNAPAVTYAGLQSLGGSQPDTEGPQPKVPEAEPGSPDEKPEGPEGTDEESKGTGGAGEASGATSSSSAGSGVGCSDGTTATAQGSSSPLAKSEKSTAADDDNDGDGKARMNNAALGLSKSSSDSTQGAHHTADTDDDNDSVGDNDDDGDGKATIKEESAVTQSASGASDGENAYTRITTDFGRRLRFVASPPDSTSGWTWYTGTQDTASTQGGLQTFSGPSKNKGVQNGYTAGLAGNVGSATVLGDFLNAVLVTDITSPLGLAAGGQAGLVAADQPVGLEITTGNGLNYSVIQTYQDIFRPVVQYGRRMLSAPLHEG